MLRLIALFVFGLTFLGAETSRAATPIEYRIAEDLGSLNWNTDEVPPLVILQIMEGLTRTGPDGRAQPALAERWVMKGKSKTVVFHLRKNARWSDGKAVCASDFVNAWNRAQDPAKPTPFIHVFQDVERYRAEGCHIIKVMLKRPVPWFPALVAHWAFFPVRVDSRPAHQLTTGPFILTHWQANQLFAMEPNPHYYGSIPTHGLRAHVIADDNTALSLFRAGRIHWMKDIPFGERAMAREMRGYQAHAALIGYFLGFDVESTPFNSRDARCAVAHALDLSQIPRILGGGEEPAQGWLPSALREHGKAASLPFNPTEAQALLVRSGLRTPVTIHYYSKDIHGPLMEWVQGQLKTNLALDVKLVRQEGATYWSNLRQKPYGVFLSGTTAWYGAPFAFFSEMLSTSTANWGRYRAHDYDRAAMAGDVQLAERLLLQRDCAIVPLYFRRTLTLASPLLTGVQVSPLGQGTFAQAKLKSPTPR